MTGMGWASICSRNRSMPSFASGDRIGDSTRVVGLVALLGCWPTCRKHPARVHLQRSQEGAPPILIPSLGLRKESPLQQVFPGSMEHQKGPSSLNSPAWWGVTQLRWDPARTLGRNNQVREQQRGRVIWAKWLPACPDSSPPTKRQQHKERQSTLEGNTCYFLAVLCVCFSR